MWVCPGPSRLKEIHSLRKKPVSGKAFGVQFAAESFIPVCTIGYKSIAMSKSLSTQTSDPFHDALPHTDRRSHSSDALLLSGAVPGGSCRGARSENCHVNKGVAKNKDSAISHSHSHLRDGDSCHRMILVARSSLWRSPRSHRDACRIRRRAGSGSNLQKGLQR